MTSSQRWGDYTSMDVDPIDGKTFWFINQILNESNQRSVWVGAFRFDDLFADGFENGDVMPWSQSVP